MPREMPSFRAVESVGERERCSCCEWGSCEMPPCLVPAEATFASASNRGWNGSRSAIVKAEPSKR